MKVLVIGGTGFIGAHTARALEARGASAIRTGLSRVTDQHLDAADGFEVVVRFAYVRPDAVVFAAGEPHVDLCERDPERSHRRNVLAVRNVADVCAANKIHLTLLSTNAVFGEGDHAEADSPAPINLYGLHKRHAEDVVRSAGCEFTIVRTANVYGWHPGGMNYLMQIVRALCNTSETFRAPTDQVGCPTHVGDVAGLLASAAQLRLSGTYHAVARPLDRYSFATAVARQFGADPARVVPCKVDDLQRSAPQARRCVLVPSPLAAHFLGHEAGIRKCYNTASACSS